MPPIGGGPGSLSTFVSVALHSVELRLVMSVITILEPLTNSPSALNGTCCPTTAAVGRACGTRLGVGVGVLRLKVGAGDGVGDGVNDPVGVGVFLKVGGGSRRRSCGYGRSRADYDHLEVEPSPRTRGRTDAR